MTELGVVAAAAEAVAAAVSDAPVDLTADRLSDRREALQNTPANGLTCGANGVDGVSPSALRTDWTVPARLALVSAAGIGVASGAAGVATGADSTGAGAGSSLDDALAAGTSGADTGRSGRVGPRSITVCPSPSEAGVEVRTRDALLVEEPRVFAGPAERLPAFESPPALSDWLLDDGLLGEAELPVSA